MMPTNDNDIEGIYKYLCWSMSNDGMSSNCLHYLEVLKKRCAPPEPPSSGPLTSTVTWRPVGQGSYRPDVESTVLVYDRYLDDVVLGYLDNGGGDDIWYDQDSAVLPDPLYWTDVPFPEEKK